jgi:hypothetical protein
VARRIAGWQREEREVGWRSGSASVSVVETTTWHSATIRPWLGGSISRGGSVVFEGLIEPRFVVVREVLT